jgi:hypothetical protein
LGIRAVPSREAEALLRFFDETVELCGVPLSLMTDNGTPFVAVMRTMLSRFQRWLAEPEIRHIRIQVDTPWTKWQDRVVLGHAGARLARSAAHRRPRPGRRRGHQLRRLLELPPPARRDWLAHTRAAF